MTMENAEILATLRAELKFLEGGGYGRSREDPWRYPQFFEESPNCPNFRAAGRPHSCDECVWMEFVPLEYRAERGPCRFIPLNEKNETVDDFYRNGSQIDAERAFGEWLQSEIDRLDGTPSPPPGYSFWGSAA
jgi:hypothetical protein